MKRLRSIVALAAALAALQAQAQVRPFTDYTDMWWNPDESGWGISIRQKLPANPTSTTVDALFAVWYTYDPRAVDPASPGGTGNVPLWFVMPGGTWTTATTYAGSIYVTSGSPYRLGWNQGEYGITKVGDFRFQFTDPGHGVFTYSISAVAGLSAMSGTKSIVRMGF